MSAFNLEVGITGAILTKLDGDSRGGAALSVKEVCVSHSQSLTKTVFEKLSSHLHLPICISVNSTIQECHLYDQIEDKVSLLGILGSFLQV